MSKSALRRESHAQCCWALANSYCSAASHLLDTHTAETFMPSMFLLLHALELHLKAYLISQGLNERQLRAIGHDLVACLRSCNTVGFRSYVSLSWAEQLQIARLNLYYRDKELEYFVPKPRTFGNVDRLRSTLDRIAKAVFDPITVESFRALRSD